MLFLLSGLAYALFCLLLARLTTLTPYGPSGTDPQTGSGRAALFPGVAPAFALIGGGVSFLFIPPGSLPPFWNSDLGLLLWLLLFLACQLAFIRPGNAAAARGTLPALLVRPVLLALAWGIAAWYARKNGMPGGLGNPGTYAALPLWSFGGWRGTLGVLSLVLAVAPLLAPPWRAGEELFQRVWRLSMAALLTAFFLPWNISGAFALPIPHAFAVDFFFFWVKTMLVTFLAPVCALFLRAIPLRAAFFLIAGLCLLL